MVKGQFWYTVFARQYGYYTVTVYKQLDGIDRLNHGWARLIMRIRNVISTLQYNNLLGAGKEIESII
jgi:hypothetical protein